MLRGSYSQKREDLALDKFLGQKRSGLYVDVGAYDPHRFSNTRRFYKRGWTGINIEPNKSNCMKFHKYRPRDINLNCGISCTESTLSFFNLSPATLSTFSESKAIEYQRQGFALVSVEDVPVKRLESILKEYTAGKRIDFLSIDTEGYDIEVLKSNDWEKYRPTLICIETAAHDESVTSDRKEGIEAFLASVNYKKIFDNGLNAIYRDNLGARSLFFTFATSRKLRPYKLSFMQRI
jgi:FkbM family methyltransferase